MLTIEIPGQTLWDEEKEEFIRVKTKTITLEHSLLAISKWESKWKKPFLSDKEPKTYEESVDYVKCMTLTQSVDPNVYLCITPAQFTQIREYMDDKMTATWFSEEQKQRGGRNRDVITSELIYYWMISYNIPFECQKWHINRLLTLIEVCNLKQEKPQKIPRGKLASRNAALNAQRRAKLHSKG